MPMKLFVRETRYSTVEVDAETFEQAADKVRLAYELTNFLLSDFNSSAFFELSTDGENYEEVGFYKAVSEEYVGRI